MNIKSMRICCTSFALPGHKGWEKLSASGGLNFGDYGDWHAALLAEDKQPLLWLLFLEDVVQPEMVVGHDGEIFDGVLRNLLAPLQNRLAKDSEPVVVAWSGWRAESVIRAARIAQPWCRLRQNLERLLYDFAVKYPSLHLINLDSVFAEQGILTAFDARNFYAARCRLSGKGIAQVAAATAAILGRLTAPAKKILVLDCDNTLWGGVVGEVGVAGLKIGGDGIGKAFSDFQKVALQLSQQGVLLALASKNNEQEVWEVFESNSSIQLKQSDFVAWRINWNEKAENLTMIAKDLDLGLDSFVFWDDNPLEREKMRLLRPEVLTLEIPEDVTQWPQLLNALDLFATFGITGEDRRKTEKYHSR